MRDGLDSVVSEPEGLSVVSDARMCQSLRWAMPDPWVSEACDRDQQCGAGMCCAVSLWIRSLRMCTPMGNLGDECHPLSHRVPFPGRRMHHTCPCLPGLACLRTAPSRFRCLPDFRKEDVFF
ncbi:prokineticin-2 isoform X1 [Agelaius phoeniceus]|uniref:prokineticin-2 isoform X1 n=1 Tax=Agelaius phoeniceus TaxID=39638 RepID=UPI004054DAE8